MKQKLMVVAVAGALAAPGLALAQAANVNVYGRIDVRVDHMKYGANTADSTPGVNSGAISALSKNHMHGSNNYLGFRGTEALGGGLSAFFQLEAGIDTTSRKSESGTGIAGAFGGRDSWLGLRSTTWGDLRGGGFAAAYRDVEGIWNVQPTAAHTASIMGSGDTTGTQPSPNCAAIISGTNALGAGAICNSATEGNQTSFHRREGNYLEWTSPVMSGFRGKIGTSFAVYKEPAANVNAAGGGGTPMGQSQLKTDMWSTALTWSGGPWAAGVAYEMHRGFRANTTNIGALGVPGVVNATVGAGVPAGSGIVTSLGVTASPAQMALEERNAKDTGWQLGGRWNFGAGSVGVGWERLRYASTFSQVATLDNGYTLKNWVINAAWNVTPAGVLSAGYSKTPGRTNCGTGLLSGAVLLTAGSTTVANSGYACGSATKATQVSMAYTHTLSKRTSLYAAYSKIDNGAGVNYYYNLDPAGSQSGGTRGGTAVGQDATRYMTGVVHTF